MADLTLNIISNMSGATAQVNEFTNAMKRATSAVSSTGEAVKKTGSAVSSAAAHVAKLGHSANKTAGFFGKLNRSLARIAVYRTMRKAISYVGEAFKTGLEAAYQFSKANQPAEYAKLAGAMDGIKKAASTMSLQLGAAFGGLITAIAPVLIRIINLVTAAADAITRFFAVLNGTGYYKKASEGFEEVGNSAGGAGKKIKGLLASWDELNVIGKESGGGGGGSSATDYSGAYVWEEATFDFDPANMAKKISAALKDALDTAINSLENYDWTALGSKIGEFIANVDWTGLVHRISELLGAALGALGETIRSALETVFGDIEGDESLAATLNKTFGWIIDNVVKPFGEGFLEAAGLDGLVQAWNLRLDQLKAAIKYALSNIEVMWRSWYAVFLESLDNPIMAPILDLLNVDLPAAISKNNDALHDAEMEADAAAITYKAVTKTIKDLKKESENPVTVKVDSDVKEPAVKLGPEKFFSHGKVVGEGYAYEIIPQLKEKLNISDWLSGNGSGKNDGVTSTGNGLALTLSVIPSLGDRSNLTNGMNKYVVRKDNPWSAYVNPIYNTYKSFKEKMTQYVTGVIWKALVNPAYNTGKPFFATLKENITGKIFSAKVDPKYNTGKSFFDTLKEKITGKIFSAKVDPKYNSGKLFFEKFKEKITGKTFDVKTNPKYGSDKTFFSTFGERVTDKTRYAPVNPKYGSDKTFFSTFDEKITGKTYSTIVNPKLSVPQTYKNAMGDLTDEKTVDIKPKLTDVKAFKEQLQSALKASASIKTTVSGTTRTIGKVSMSEYAQGGWPDVGEIFISREAGPELVGTIGGSTAVANNDDIVQGIQGGVERANSEQNELIRQQNSILMQLLNKELTISPSVALGQVMARSAALYGRA